MHSIRFARFNALVHVCKGWPHKDELKGDFNTEAIYGLIEDMAPKLEQTLRACHWQQQKINCSEYFTPVITRGGLCFAFNVLNFYDMHTDM